MTQYKKALRRQYYQNLFIESDLYESETKDHIKESLLQKYRRLNIEIKQLEEEIKKIVKDINDLIEQLQVIIKYGFIDDELRLKMETMLIKTMEYFSKNNKDFKINENKTFNDDKKSINNNDYNNIININNKREYHTSLERCKNNKFNN